MAPTQTRSRIKTVHIDGKAYSAHEEQTILQVARENDIYIPTLCEKEGLSISGACRLCVVEIQGWRKLAASCSTHVDEGMVITTHSEKLDKYRRMIIELLFSEGSHVCAVCVSNDNCELQNLAETLGMDHVRFPNLQQIRLVDLSNDRFIMDRNRCVLCGRCVRVCDEIEGAHTWDIKGRGTDARIVSDLDTPWGKSATCTTCGKCVNICPVGALVRRNRPAGTMVKRRDILYHLSEMREVKK